MNLINTESQFQTAEKLKNYVIQSSGASDKIIKGIGL